MNFGAGIVAARVRGKSCRPRPYASGTIKKIFEKYPKLGPLIPAMGYSDSQKKELEEAINSTPAEIALIATPVDLSRVLKLNKPYSSISYEIEEMESPGLKGLIENFVKSRR
jgi:predicted GTPase